MRYAIIENNTITNIIEADENTPSNDNLVFIPDSISVGIEDKYIDNFFYKKMTGLVETTNDTLKERIAELSSIIVDLEYTHILQELGVN